MTSTTDKLLLSVHEAAQSLSISERTLWSFTQPRGSIPSIKIGARTLYGVDALRRYIADAETGGREHE